MYGNDGSVDVSLRWRRDLGVPADLGDRPAVSRLGGHAAPVQRLHRPAGQRQLVRTELGARAARSWLQDWFRVGGGDGFYTAMDPTDPTRHLLRVARTGSVSRVDLRTGSSQSIRPRAGGGAGGGRRRRRVVRGGTGNIVPAPAAGTQIRWNWNTPFMLSPHNSSTVLLRGQSVLRLAGSRPDLDHEPRPDQADRPRHPDHHGRHPVLAADLRTGARGAVHPLPRTTASTSSAAS